jgi:hypothetical protein
MGDGFVRGFEGSCRGDRSAWLIDGLAGAGRFLGASLVALRAKGAGTPPAPCAGVLRGGPGVRGCLRASVRSQASSAGSVEFFDFEKMHGVGPKFVTIRDFRVRPGIVGQGALGAGVFLCHLDDFTTCVRSRCWVRALSSSATQDELCHVADLEIGGVRFGAELGCSLNFCGYPSALNRKSASLKWLSESGFGSSRVTQ